MSLIVAKLPGRGGGGILGGTGQQVPVAALAAITALALFTMPASQWRTCTGYPGIDWNTQAIGLKEKSLAQMNKSPDQTKTT